MSIFDDIKRALTAGRNKLSVHSMQEMINDNLLPTDVIATTLVGEFIEDYPKAFPFPACLVLGRLAGGACLHAVWAYDSTTDYPILVTTYRPDPARWSADFRKRVKR